MRKIDHPKYGNLRSKVAYLSEKFEVRGNRNGDVAACTVNTLMLQPLLYMILPSFSHSIWYSFLSWHDTLIQYAYHYPWPFVTSPSLYFLI
jgi:hypothetical protein